VESIDIEDVLDNTIMAIVLVDGTFRIFIDDQPEATSFGGSLRGNNDLSLRVDTLNSP